MKFRTIVAAVAVTLLTGSIMTITSPAFASDGSCQWGGSGFAGGAVVSSNSVNFSCSVGGVAPQWVPTGQTGAEGTTAVPGVFRGLDPSGLPNGQDPSSFSPGATIQDLSTGQAWSLGSTWDDIGSWDAFAQSVDGGGGGCTDCELNAP
jgi:hypothetical protein